MRPQDPRVRGAATTSKVLVAILTVLVASLAITSTVLVRVTGPLYEHGYASAGRQSGAFHT